MKNKILIMFTLLSFLAIGVGSSTTYFQYVQLRDEYVIEADIYFNNEVIHYTRAQVQHELWRGFIQFEQLYENPSEQNLVSRNIVNSIRSDINASISYITPDGQWMQVENVEEIVLEYDGVYQFQVIEIRENENIEYQFDVLVEIEPEIFISNLEPVQGDIITIKLSNLPRERSLKLESHFRPSALFETAHEAYWYVPIAYRENAQTYPLVITMNEQTYAYTLDVQSYAFKEIRFNVDSSIVSSTVGNPEAVLQYRAVIWPTYETYDPEDYWTDPFIIPVKDARISSTFGEMRYVNNATTPSRHAGIDYAIACGTNVYASNSGKVEVSEFLIMIGNTVIIDHGLGLKTYYLHMDSLRVKAGDRVERGQVIGTVGTTGYSTGCHLHFQPMIKNQSFNPEFLYRLRK